MFVSDSHRLLYLAPPKTGSTTVGHVLRQAPFYGYQQALGTQHNTIWDDRYRDYYIFLSVRHPYTRAVSFWRYGCKRALEHDCGWRDAFRQWFNAGLPNVAGFFRIPDLADTLRGMWRCSWHCEQVPRPIDKLVRFERFAADLAEIESVNLRTLPHLNPGVPSNRPWHSFLESSAEAVELIQEFWAEDFDRFGYTRDLEACIRGEFFVEGSGLL